MKKFILASTAAVALFGIAACSDNTDKTTTQSTTPPAKEQSTPPAASPATPAQPNTNGGTTQPEKPAAPAQ